MTLEELVNELYYCSNCPGYKEVLLEVEGEVRPLKSVEIARRRDGVKVVIHSVSEREEDSPLDEVCPLP